MKKRVLITGASGFVGFHLLNQALASGLEVFAAVRKNSNVMHLQHLDIQYVYLNYASIDEMKQMLEPLELDYIVHAAGSTKAKAERDYNRINAEYSRNLAVAAMDLTKPLEKFLFVSSLAAIGPLTVLDGQIGDHTVPRPVTSYGKSKLLAEQYLKEVPSLPLLVIRPTAVYGPREKDILILFKSISKGLEPYIGKFEQQFSFVYVKDLAELIVMALGAQVLNKSYNISDGFTYHRYAIADFTKSILNKKTIKFHLPVGTVGALAALMDVVYAKSSTTPTLNKEKMAELTAVNWACDISSLKKDIGYVPKFNLKEGLAETLSWYKENNWL